MAGENNTITKPRNVFISFLGTTNYVETIYTWKDGAESNSTRFVQEAILDRIARDWTENDKIIIFYTEKSKILNWEDCGQRNGKGEFITTGIESQGLFTRLKKMQLRAGIEHYPVPEGISENEVWDIFNIVYSKLIENDKINLDVTHAFRSIPLFASTLINFSKYIKHTEIVSINYGAFEKLLDKVDRFDDSKFDNIYCIPLEERKAPIVDMINLVNLQELTETATSIAKYGRLSTLSENISLDNKADSEKGSFFINKISEAIKNIDYTIQTNNIRMLKDGKLFVEFRNNLKGAKNKGNLNEAEKILLKNVEEELKDFVSEDSYKNVEAAIDWTIRHDMLQQTATLAQEYIISYSTDIIRKLGFINPYVQDGKKEDNKLRKKYRTFIGSILGIKQEDVVNKKFEGELSIYPSHAESLLNTDYIKNIRSKYEILRKVRNSLNHGNGEFEYDDIKLKVKEAYNECLNILHQYPLVNS